MVYFLNQDILPVCFYNMVPQTAKTDWKVKGKKQEARDKKSLKQFHSQRKATCVYVPNGSSLPLPNSWVLSTESDERIF